MLDWKRCRSYLAAAAVAASLGACGGSGTCPAGTTGAPPNCNPIVPPTTVAACTQTKVDSDAGPVEGNTLYFFDFSVPDTGRLDITLDWTNPTSAFGLFVVPVNTCTIQEFNARSCNFLVRSEFATTPKPRKISVPNFAAGNYRWLLGTISKDAESVSYQFVLSKGSCAPLTGSQPSVSAQGAGVFHSLARAKAR